MDVLRPTTGDEVREAVAWALSAGRTLDLVSGGTKRGLGRPVAADTVLDLAGVAGVSLYEPEELVLTAGPGTSLREIAGRLARHGQCLAFEPPDLGPLLGGAAGGATLGGVIATNLSGPRRIKAGAARDHFLGVKAVSGRGEVFKSGGRVVKNVTGYDLPKLMAGSYGTLAAMTEITVKVLPAAEKLRTVLIGGLDDRAGAAAMSRALSGRHDVSAAAHLPAAIAAASSVERVREMGGAVTALRIEGPEPSVPVRCEALRASFEPDHRVDELHGRDSAALWREVGGAACFASPPDALVWRLSVPPAEGPRTVAAIRASVPAEAFYDWGGGLVWLALPGDVAAAGAPSVRAAVEDAGGHASLIRAPEALRRTVPVFHPQPAGRAALGARVKAAFDPKAILNPGRMYDGN